MIGFQQSKIVKRQNTGFSIVEMLVYISVLTVVSTSSILLLFSLQGLIAENRANQQITRSGTAVMERLLSDIRGAEAVNVGASTLTTSPGVLALTEGAVSTVYSVSGDDIVVSVDGTSLGPLTEDNVAITELRFFHYDNTITEAVRVRMTLTASIGDVTSSETFRGMAVLLGSYD